MRVLLLSCYELGHAPLGLAMPAAFLAAAGHDVDVIDLSVDPLDATRVRAAEVVGLSVPMHTALRLGAVALARVRELNPRCRVIAYGLYAPLNADYLRACGADAVVGGESEAALVDLVEPFALSEARPSTGSGRTERESTGPSTAASLREASARGERTVALERLGFPVPRRDGLPALARYARLRRDGRDRLAGYTVASRGCLHMCRHCPIPPVYGGRFFVLPAEVVLADVAAQVEAGAEHVSFGDPDFFCGPGHGMHVLRALHARWPELSFDVTIKVEHLLRHADRLPELGALGCAFVVSAGESIEDGVLARLAKGHTRADTERALDLARAAGLVVRPTFVPFNPWTSLDGLIELVEWIERRDLVACVDPVQLTVRLLVPPGSLLLSGDAAADFGPFDPSALTHIWTHRDPRVDALQRTAEAVAADGGGYEGVRRAYYAAAGRAAPPLGPPAVAAPRLTEPWFC